jgi:hypothetical protein
MPAPAKFPELVKRFEANREACRSGSFLKLAVANSPDEKARLDRAIKAAAAESTGWSRASTA